jgi:hypothetical protein
MTIHATYLVPYSNSGLIPHQAKVITPQGGSYNPPTEWRWKHREYETTSDFFAGVQAASASRAAVLIRNRVLVPDPIIVRKRDVTIDAQTPTSWVCLDYDIEGNSLPNFERDKMNLISSDSDVKISFAENFIAKHLRGSLPKWASSCRKLVHLSSSWMMKKASFHVYFVCDSPIPQINLKSLILDCKADYAMSHVGQVHIIADPIFKDVCDPWDGLSRWFEIDGEEAAELPRKFTKVSSLDRYIDSDSPLESINYLPVPTEIIEWSFYGNRVMGEQEMQRKKCVDGQRHDLMRDQAKIIRRLIFAGDLDRRAIDAWGCGWYETFGYLRERKREIERSANFWFGGS